MNKYNSISEVDLSKINGGKKKKLPAWFREAAGWAHGWLFD